MIYGLENLKANPYKCILIISRQGNGTNQIIELYAWNLRSPEIVKIDEKMKFLTGGAVINMEIPKIIISK